MSYGFEGQIERSDPMQTRAILNQVDRILDLVPRVFDAETRTEGKFKFHEGFEFRRWIGGIPIFGDTYTKEIVSIVHRRRDRTASVYKIESYQDLSLSFKNSLIWPFTHTELSTGVKFDYLQLKNEALLFKLKQALIEERFLGLDIGTSENASLLISDLTRVSKACPPITPADLRVQQTNL